MAKTTLTKQNEALKKLLKEAYSRKHEVCDEGADWFEKVKKVMGDELTENFENVSLNVNLSNCELPARFDVYDSSNYEVEVKFKDGQKLAVNHVDVNDVW